MTVATPHRRRAVVRNTISDAECHGCSTDAPTITGTPATSVNEDAFYQLSRRGADDVDAGAFMTYSSTPRRPGRRSYGIR